MNGPLAPVIPRSYENLIPSLIDPTFTAVDALAVLAQRVTLYTFGSSPNYLKFVDLALNARTKGWAVVQPVLQEWQKVENLALADIHSIGSIALICLNNSTTRTVEEQKEVYNFIYDRWVQGLLPSGQIRLVSLDNQIAFINHCLAEINKESDDDDINISPNLVLVSCLPVLWRQRYGQTLPVNVIPGALDPFTKACIRFSVAELNENPSDPEHVRAVEAGVRNYPELLISLPRAQLDLTLLQEVGHVYAFGAQMHFFEDMGLSQFCPGFLTQFIRGALRGPHDAETLIPLRQFCFYMKDRIYDQNSRNEINILYRFLGALLDNTEGTGMPMEQLPHLLINYDQLIAGLTLNEIQAVTELLRGQIKLAAEQDGIDLGAQIIPAMATLPRRDRIFLYLRCYFDSVNCNGIFQIDLFYEYLLEGGILDSVRNDPELYKAMREYYNQVITTYWRRYPQERTIVHVQKERILSQFFL